MNKTQQSIAQAPWFWLHPAKYGVILAKSDSVRNRRRVSTSCRLSIRNYSRVAIRVSPMFFICSFHKMLAAVSFFSSHIHHLFIRVLISYGELVTFMGDLSVCRCATEIIWPLQCFGFFVSRLPGFLEGLRRRKYQIGHLHTWSLLIQYQYPLWYWCITDVSQSKSLRNWNILNIWARKSHNFSSHMQYPIISQYTIGLN